MKMVSDAGNRKPGSPVHAPSFLPAADFSLLISALRNFGAAWSVSRHPSPPGTRKGDAILAFILCACIVAIAYVADEACALWATTLPLPIVGFFAKVTLLGTSGYIFALCVIVAVVAVLASKRGGRQVEALMNGLAGRATFVFAVNIVGGIVSQILKHVAGRARPKLMSIVGPFHFDLFSIRASLASFPSGHTITVFATAMALSYFAPRLRVPLFLVAALVAVSRLAIEAHYVSDVLTGIVIGVGTAIYLRRAFARRGLVFRYTGSRIHLRAAGSAAAALALLADRGSR
jgi:undecaprenyl-diphosphatase